MSDSNPPVPGVTGRPNDQVPHNSTLAERAGKARPAGANAPSPNTTFAERIAARNKQSSGGTAKASVDDVLAGVGDDPELAADALAAELSQKKPRKTLVEALEALIASDSGD